MSQNFTFISSSKFNIEILVSGKNYLDDNN